MTISSTIRKAGPYPGNGSTVALPFTFKVFTAADVLAVKAVTATGAESTLTLDADYTVSLNADQNTSPGGTLTLAAAHATGTTVTLTSQVANTQGMDLTNAGGFYPRVINDALDRTTIQIQQLAEKVSRSLLSAVSSSTHARLPAPAATKVLAWNAAGTDLENVDMIAGQSSLADTLASGAGTSIVGHTPDGTGSVASSVAEFLDNNVRHSIFRFLSPDQAADVRAGTRTLDLTAKLQSVVNVCILLKWNLHIPTQARSIKISAPIVIDHDLLGESTFAIVGDAKKGYYQGGGSEIYYTGTTGYVFQITGRLADVGGTNEGAPMSVTIEGLNFAGNTSAFGAISVYRAWFVTVRRNNFYGFGNTSAGVVAFSASGVTAGSPIAFAGSSFVSDNYFASSGRCVWLTGGTGGVVNMVRISNNQALDQRYFVSADFGVSTPYTLAIHVIDNHVEGTLVNDVYSQGAGANLRVIGNYFEQNNNAQNAPRVVVDGSNNFGIYVEQNTFSKSLAAAGAGSTLVRIANADGVSVVNNQSNYGGSLDRFSVDLLTCTNAEAEPFSSVTKPIYPVRVNGYPIRSGKVTDNWMRVPAGGTGGFVGLSSGDGFPGASVCTVAAEVSKTNGHVRLNFKATLNTKSGSGTSTLIGVFPYTNNGLEVIFPVFSENVGGAKPLYGKLPAGLTVATIYDANGVPLNFQTAFSVGSVISANINYLTQE